MTMSRAGTACYLCDRCGRDVSELSLAAPCRCGALERRRIDPEASYRRPPSTDAPRWDPLRDWTAKYLQLSWNVNQLRRLYTPGSGAEVEEVRRIVEMSFGSAIGLGEWLSSGPEPVAVTPGDVDRLLAAEPLAICRALAAPAEQSARIVPVGFVSPPHFWVEHRRPGARPVRYDALDLAERCLSTWQSFLTRRGVALPSWRD